MSSPIDVVLVTWPHHPDRIKYFCRTHVALRKNLTASRHELRYLVSSESEHNPPSPWCGDALEKICASESGGVWHADGMPLHWRQGPASLGAGMNAALMVSTAPLIFLVQDDFELMEPLDLSPGADLLTAHSEVDLIRYLWPESLGCRFKGDVEGWRRFDLAGPWPYGDEPHLRRRDFMDRHGWYSEGVGHHAEGNMIGRIVTNKATILAADRMYFGHFGLLRCPHLWRIAGETPTP